MVDRNRNDFYHRVGRIERTHERGGGFEAEGTLGMTFYNSLRPRTRRSTMLMPLALILCTVVAIKAGVLINIGEQAYAERVARLQEGSTADRVGAYVLQADPLTQYVAELISQLAR